MLISYLDLSFDVLHAATKNRYADNNCKRLVNLGPIALSRNYKLTTSSGNHIKDISHALIVSLMYKLITNAKGCDDLSFGFQRDCGVRQQRLSNNKTIKVYILLQLY